MREQVQQHNDAFDQVAQPQPNSAIEIRTTTPTTVDVTTPDPVPGVNPHLLITFFTGPIAPAKFQIGQTMQLDANFAVQLGEYLVAEGTKARSGIVVAKNQLATARG